MKIKLIRSYKKLNKNNVPVTVFVYGVSGTEQQLESYKDAAGDNYREDEKGIPMWFTTNFVGTSGEIIITSSNKVVADMSKFDQAASIASQYGGNLGQELARLAAAQLMGNRPIVQETVAPASVSAEKESEEVEK